MSDNAVPERRWPHFPHCQHCHRRLWIKTERARRAYPLPSQSTSELSVPTELTELTEPTESSISPPVVSVVSDISPQIDGTTGETTRRLPISSPFSPSVSGELNEPNDPNDSPFSSVSSFRPLQTDGLNGELNDAVENSENLDPNGWPLCTGGCGLPIGPVDIAKGRTHHGFCS